MIVNSRSLGFIFGWLIVLTLPFGVLGKIVVGNTSVYFLDLLMVFWLFLGFIARNKVKKEIFFFMILTILNYLRAFGQYPKLDPLFEVLFWGRTFAWLIFLEWQSNDYTFKIFFSASMKLFLIFAILTSWSLQFIFLPTLVSQLPYGYDPHTGRVFGTLFDTNLIGVFLGILTLWCIPKIQSFINFKTNQKLWLTIFLWTSVLLVLSYSRSIWLSMICTLLIFYYKKLFNFKLKYLVHIMIFMFIFNLVLLLAPKYSSISQDLTRSVTIKSRISDYQHGLSAWYKNPIFGVGLSGVRDSRIRAHPEYLKGLINVNSLNYFSSSSLFVLVSTGLIGVVFFILYFYQIWKNLDKNSRLIFTFLLISANFDNNFFHTLVIFWLIVFIKVKKTNFLQN